MKKLLAVAMAGGLLIGGAGFAQASHTNDPNDHKPQDYGLCTAIGSGNKKGWEKNGTPPPFQDLISRADDGNPNTTNDLETFCAAATPGNK